MRQTLSVAMGLEGFGRWRGPAFAALPPALLAFSLVLALVVDDAGGLAVLASAVLAAWMAAGEWVLPARGVPARAAWFAVLVALLLAVLAVSPLFGFVAWTGYIYVARALPRRAFPAGVLAVAACTALSQVGGNLDGWSAVAVYAALVVVNATVAGFVMWFAALSEEQSEQRRRAVAELERTLEENAALQAQLVEQARAAGVADERGRLAREIHDTLAQGLVGIITQLEAAQGDGDWRRHHDAAARLARESLTEARRSVDALRPEPLRDARLPEALADVAARWSALHGVAAEVTTTGEPQPMRPEVEVTLLRTAQEGLANVAKHARASRVGLTLSYMGDSVTLDVRDDGVGFAAANGGAPAAAGDAARPHSGGFGLVAMRERVARLDGTLAVESEPGGGTALSATVPAEPV